MPRRRYDWDFALRIAIRIVLSVVLGCVVTEALYVLDKLGPYSSIRDRVTDFLTFPGFIIARLFYLWNIRPGSGGSAFWWAFFFSNSFFYAVLCFVILDILHLPPEFPEL